MQTFAGIQFDRWKFLARGRAAIPDETVFTIMDLRIRGVRLIALLGWFAAFAIVGSARLGDTEAVRPALVAIAMNILPTIMALRGRHDLRARLIVGTLAAGLPALFVYVMQDQAWQTDGHMYFFVALSALVVLCDWRPIALASVLIALHHLLFMTVAPAWVFTGAGEVGRVIFHFTMTPAPNFAGLRRSPIQQVYQ